MTYGSHFAAAVSTFQRQHEIERKKASDQISGAKNNPRKETFIVHRGWHAGPILQQRSQRFQGGMGSKEKGSSQKSRGQKIQEKKEFSFIEDDMRDPWASRFLNVSKAAWDRKKKASDKISGAKDNPRKETLLYIEDDMRVPFSSSGLNVSNAAWDQKKKKVDCT